MRAKLALALSGLALPLLGLGALAAAQTRAPAPRVQPVPLQGLYIGAAAGMNFRHDAKYTEDGITFTASPSQPGFAGLLAIGYGLGNGLRFEIEGSVRQNSVGNVGVAGINIPGAGGDLRSWGIMVNAIGDLNLGNAFTPYLGAGIGVAINDWQGVGASGSVEGIPYRLRVNGTDTTFAYQAIAGVAYEIKPGLAATAEYRFFGTLNPSMGASVTVGDVSASGRFTPGDNFNHSIMIGLRYSFGAPPRPAIPFHLPSPTR